MRAGILCDSSCNEHYFKTEIEDVIRRVEPKVIAFVSNIGSANNIDL